MDKSFKKLCSLAGEAAVKYRLIETGDRILVALSGGKDSFALLEVLDYLKERAPVDFDFEAATFDPGFAGFNVDGIAGRCAERGWKHHIVALNVSDVISEKHFDGAPCVLCSRLRRGKLYGLAAQLGCGKLALGQHLDDIIASFLMSLCRGQGLSTMAPRVESDAPGAPVVIRPLALAPEALIADCASTWHLPDAGRCRYEEQLKNGDRAYFRRLTDQLAAKIPDVRANVLHSLGRVELEHLMLRPTPPADDAKKC